MKWKDTTHPNLKIRKQQRHQKSVDMQIQNITVKVLWGCVFVAEEQNPQKSCRTCQILIKITHTETTHNDCNCRLRRPPIP